MSLEPYKDAYGRLDRALDTFYLLRTQLRLMCAGVENEFHATVVAEFGVKVLKAREEAYAAKEAVLKIDPNREQKRACNARHENHWYTQAL